MLTMARAAFCCANKGYGREFLSARPLFGRRFSLLTPHDNWAQMHARLAHWLRESLGHAEGIAWQGRGIWHSHAARPTPNTHQAERFSRPRAHTSYWDNESFCMRLLTFVREQVFESVRLGVFSIKTGAHLVTIASKQNFGTIRVQISTFMGKSVTR